LYLIAGKTWRGISRSNAVLRGRRNAVLEPAHRLLIRL
jgi:hypothetical protein